MKRPRYQFETLYTEPRKTGPDVWVYRWRETNQQGSRQLRKQILGTVLFPECAVYVVGIFGGPDRDRTDDLFHAISATSRNSLELHDTNRDEPQQNARFFPVIGPLLDPREVSNGSSQRFETRDGFVQHYMRLRIPIFGLMLQPAARTNQH